jgi:polyhydroxybutyrate depolymerase
MSSAIACQYSGRVAAVAPVAGIQAMTPCRTTRPVPVVAFHGTADPLVRYDGKPSKLAADLPAPDGSGHRIDARHEKLFGAKGVFQQGPSIPQEAADWAARNGCSGTVTTTRISSKVSLLSWRCPHHADVDLYRIAGFGHTWPAAATGTGGSGTTGSSSISADAVMWRFFEAHPLSSSD